MATPRGFGSRCWHHEADMLFVGHLSNICWGAGLGIGMNMGNQKFDKRNYELADNAINQPKVILVNRK